MSSRSYFGPACRWPLAWVPLGLLGAAGCWSPIDLSERQCPCDEGWTCVADRCVEGGLPEDAGADAPMDAGADAPLDAGSATCPLGTFCEDFESTSPLANGWSAFPDLERVALVDARDPDPRITAHRGTGMLRVSTDTLGGAAELEICPFTGFICPTDLADAGTIPDGGVPPGPGLTAGDIYMRAYVYVPTSFADGRPFEMGHASVMHVGAHRGPFVAGEDVVGFNLDVDRVAMYVGTSVDVGRIDPRPALGDMDGRPVFPRDTWVCIRTHVLIDGLVGSVATYMGSDDVPEVSREEIDTLPSLPFVHFGVGLGYTSEMPGGALLYIDDVAVGRTPIPCLE